MTITHRVTNGLQAGTTSPITWTIPVGHTTNDLLLAWLGCKPYSLTVASGTITTDYTSAGSKTSGTTANGVGVGSVLTQAWYRTHDGSEVAPTGTQSAAPSPRMVGMSAYYKSNAGAWLVASTTGADTSASGTSVSVTSDAALDLAPGDVLLIAATLPDDTANVGSFAVSASGITFGTITQRLGTTGTTSGNDGAFYVWECPVTSGTATVTVTFTGTNTNSGEAEAAAVFVRLREPSGAQLGDVSLTVTPSLSSSSVVEHVATGTLAAAPTVAASAFKVLTATAAMTATPGLTATGAKVQAGSAALSVTPVVSAAAISYHVLVGTASLTVTPSLSAAAVTTSGQVGTASLTVTPSLSAAGARVAVATTALSVVPALAATGQVQQYEAFAATTLHVQPTTAATGYRYLTATGVPLTVVPALTAEGIATPDGGFIMAAAQLADARAQWADANNVVDGTLTDLLEAAWVACLAYLPTSVTTAPGFAPDAVPAYVQANVLHARDLFQAAQRNGDVIGFDTYAVRVRPLSDTVRALLRPSTGRALVG